MTKIAPFIQASDPMRFRPGGSRGGGGAGALTDPAIGSAIGDRHPSVLEVLEEQLHTLRGLLEEMARHQRLQLDRVWQELFYETSASTAYPQATTSDFVRITYIFAYIGGGKTGNLNLIGGQSQTIFALPIPANTQPPLIFTCGDGETGGIVLRPQDLRTITTGDGSKQQIIGALLGERIRDSYLA